MVVSVQGLTSKASLSALAGSIRHEIQVHKEKKSKFSSKHWLIDSFHHSNKKSILHWPSILFIIFAAITVFVGHLKEEKSDTKASLTVECFVIILLLSLNIFVVALDSCLQHKEILKAIENILTKIEECKSEVQWAPENYPDLELPLSPAINLQWTYRDGNLVNLPWSLLVKGDVIALHPGQKAPADCISYRPDGCFANGLRLNRDEVYCPEIEKMGKETINAPKARKPLPVQLFILMETPYIRNVRLALSKSLDRPPSMFDKELYVIRTHYLEYIITPSLIVLVITVNIFRHFYLKTSMSTWTSSILLQPVHVVLPLLPLKFPLCYTFLNLFGVSRIVRHFYMMKLGMYKSEKADSFSSNAVRDESKLDNGFSSFRIIKSLFFGHEIDEKVWLHRTSNVMLTLGSMTSLCCVDKKGLLSWPNPTAEKVFFFKNPSNTPDVSSRETLYHSSSTISKNEKHGAHPADDDQSINTGPPFLGSFTAPESKVEILDLTHNNRLPFALQFDDPNWKQYLNSLKPLGLNILLNTCNPKSQPQYINFCSYLAREALSDEISISAINRRCLCELSKQIGFVDHASEVFQFEKQLSFFRHVQEEIVRKDKFTRSLDVKKLKCAMPNAISIVTRDTLTGTPQLMSQGTADILIDLCSDYWDGNDLIPITQTEKKKILDFYHRNSLTAYCSAFSYRPITTPISDQFSSVYFELPPDYNQFFHHSFCSTQIRSWEPITKNNRLKTIHYLSSDSIFQHESSDHFNDDPEISLQQVCNQIFIGMVTMQYQARSDIVRLIEHLDEACIRFVHFSKENELRSRVFSEKMGLESGWNCHISLLTDKVGSQKSIIKQNVASDVSKKGSQANNSKDDAVNVKNKLLNADLSQKVHRSHSAPIAVHYEIDTLKFSNSPSIEASLQQQMDKSSGELSPAVRSPTISLECDDRSDSCNETSQLLGADGIELIVSDVDNETIEIVSFNESETDSSDQSGPVAFDMSNRAKLPKGIENIRPHLESIDNVPLLVSLFTDCTPDTTCEMIEIMQEHNEIICCIGSVTNCYNMSVFLKSDVSIGVIPLYPQICMKKSVIGKELTPGAMSPTKIGSILNSFPCTLTYHRDDPIDLYQLIKEARHYLTTLKTSFSLMLYCCMTITLMQILATILLLPPVLTGCQILWLTCFVIPIISISTMASPSDSRVMFLATDKIVRTFDGQAMLLFWFYFFGRFFFTALVCLMCFGLSFQNLCHSNDHLTIPCHVLKELLNKSTANTTETGEYVYNFSLGSSQSLVACCLTLYFALTSATFVYRSSPILKKNVFKNKYWLFSNLIVIVLQILYTLVKFAIKPDYFQPFRHIPYYVWIIVFVWAVLVIPVNEFIKIYEIRVNVRLQKRARLEFGTKLGMNSPF